MGLAFLDWLFYSPASWLFAAFALWMLIDALRRREFLWALFIVVTGFAAIWYFFYVYRGSPEATRGFELPGAHDRRRIKELQAQIHHLDKAHHHFQLGDIYFQRGKLEKAEACYRAAIERDPQDIDIRAHLGQCLLRLKRPAEARPLLEGVCKENSKHDYGYSLMALAETLAALNEIDNAITVWEQVLDQHSYARARYQLAELYAAKGKTDLAQRQLEELLSDDIHAPAFQRKRDRVWVRRAKRLKNKLR
jgi:tetratricopeptide (TPR) repeat protein